MKRSLTIVTLATLFASAAAAQTTPDRMSYNLVNLHTYVRSPYYVGWGAAQQYARSLGGYLASINDGSEQTFVQLAYGPPFAEPLWIGLNDAASEGTFAWDSGEPVTFLNFCAGEPNNFNGNEDHVEIFSTHTGGSPCWNDTSSPYIGPGSAAVRGLVELAHGPRVNFDTTTASCGSSPFPTPLGATSHPEGISWNGAGASSNRYPSVETIVGNGMPVTGAKYLRVAGTGIHNVSGPYLNRPVPTSIAEVRVAIPPGTKGISLAYDFYCPESPGTYNDGMDISVVDALGNSLGTLVYHSANSSSFSTIWNTSPFCYTNNGYNLWGLAPQTAVKDFPILTYPAYLSIVCWNGTDDAISSAVHVDAIQFWGSGKFDLKMSAPTGPGSLQLANTGGTPNAPYWTGVTLAQGAFPYGWLFGLDITLGNLLSQVGSGAPFSGTLNGLGASTFTIPVGVPPGIPVYAVSLQFGAEVTASAPRFFLTP